MAEVSLYINIVSLIVSFALLRRSYKSNNLIALMFILTLVFLVVGQAVHISVSLLDMAEVTYHNNYINQEGHLLASGMLLYIIILIFFLSLRLQTNSSNCFAEWAPAANDQYKLSVFYGIQWAMLLFNAVAVIALVGGFNVWITSDRPLAPGSTFLIFAVGMAAYPLLISLSYNQATTWHERLLFLTSFLLIMSFSRFLAIFKLLILLFAYYYRSKNCSIRLYKKELILGFLLIGFIMFGYGTYRHVVARIDNPSFINIIDYTIDNPENTLMSVDLNYRIAIEGMSGLSGVLSESIQTSDSRFDGGISMLSVGVKMIPSFFREYISEIDAYISSIYWYHGSIVPGGLECFFVHFSFFMLILYPIAFCGYTYCIHNHLMKTANAERKLFLIVIAIFGLQLIRGSTITLFVFTGAELLVVSFSLLLRRYFI